MVDNTPVSKIRAVLSTKTWLLNPTSVDTGILCLQAVRWWAKNPLSKYQKGPVRPGVVAVLQEMVQDVEAALTKLGVDTDAIPEKHPTYEELPQEKGDYNQAIIDNAPDHTVRAEVIDGRWWWGGNGYPDAEGVARAFLNHPRYVNGPYKIKVVDETSGKAELIRDIQ